MDPQQPRPQMTAEARGLMEQQRREAIAQNAANGADRDLPDLVSDSDSEDDEDDVPNGAEAEEEEEDDDDALPELVDDDEDDEVLD